MLQCAVNRCMRHLARACASSKQIQRIDSVEIICIEQILQCSIVLYSSIQSSYQLDICCQSLHLSVKCSQESQLSAMGDRDPILEKGDLIPEKMHIHFGLKDSNPVDRMRFFAKVLQPQCCSSCSPSPHNLFHSLSLLRAVLKCTTSSCFKPLARTVFVLSSLNLTLTVEFKPPAPAERSSNRQENRRERVREFAT